MAKSRRSILIHALGEGGHIGPTLKTAGKLRDRGDRVIYMAELPAKNRIEGEGYEYLPFLPDVYLADAKASTTLDWCHEYAKNMVDELVSGRLEKQLAPLNLDLILHDVTRPHTGWLARALEIPFLRVNTSFPCGFDPGVPPVWSDALPGELSFQEHYLEWRVFQGMMRDKPALRSPLVPSHKEYYERLESLGLEISQVWWASSAELVHGEAELIMTSKTLDFPSPNRPPEWVYAGPSLQPDASPDWTPPGRREGAPLILCVFGGQAFSYPRLMKQLPSLIKAFAARPEIDVVLAGPPQLVANIELPASVQHVEWMPQRSLLRQTDLLISHGGQSSIKEAIWEGVPQLVCPQAWDQRGNAARVVYHGVGDRVLDDEPSPASLGGQIDELLANPSYKAKAAAIGAKLRAENDSNEDLRLIDLVMSGEFKPPSRQSFLDLENRIRKNFLG
jgi:MGT family glycosyltransferase